MFKSQFINGDDAKKNLFKQFSNKPTKTKTLAKKKYFQCELASYNGVAKKTWEILLDLIPTTIK